MSATPPPFPNNPSNQNSPQPQDSPYSPAPEHISAPPQPINQDMNETEVIRPSPHSHSTRQYPQSASEQPDFDETEVITPHRYRMQDGNSTSGRRSNNSGLLWLAGGIAVLIIGVAIAAYCFFATPSSKRTFDYDAPVAAEAVSVEAVPEIATASEEPAGMGQEVSENVARASHSVVAWNSGANVLKGVFQGSRKPVDFVIRADYSAADGRLQNAVLELDKATTTIRLTTATVSTDGTVIYMAGQSSLGNVHIEASAQPQSNVFKGTMEFGSEQGGCVLTLSSK